MEENKNEEIKKSAEPKAPEKKEEPKKTNEVKTEAKKEEPKKNNESKKTEPKKPIDSAKKKKAIRIAILVLIFVIVIAAVIIYFAVFHKKTIDLADYIEVNYYTENSSSYYYDYESDTPAYNGYATASVSLDEDKLKDLLDTKRATERFIEKATLTVENDNNGNLSNGDTLEIKIDISENYLDDQKLKLKNDTITVNVEGLEEADVLDLFGEDDFEVEVTGISPDLSVSVNNNSSDEFIKDNVTYSVSEYSGIANGDTITITAYYDETAALEEGIIIADDTYEYTVEGMPEYIDSVDELSGTTLETLRAGFVEYVNDAIQDEGVYIISSNYDGVEYGAEYTTSEPELMATYLLTRKGTASSWNSDNRVSAIYKVVYTITSTGATYEWYYVVSTNDVAVQDGNLYNAEEISYSVSGSWDDGKTQEEAYDDLIDSYKTNYVIETVE